VSAEKCSQAGKEIVRRPEECNVAHQGKEKPNDDPEGVGIAPLAPVCDGDQEDENCREGFKSNFQWELREESPGEREKDSKDSEQTQGGEGAFRHGECRPRTAEANYSETSRRMEFTERGLDKCRGLEDGGAVAIPEMGIRTGFATTLDN